MRNLYYLLVISLTWGFLLPQGKAQDAYFSQYYANPIYLNSALAGAEGNPRLVFIHRQQWNALNAYNSSVFSFDTPLGKSSGMAVHAMNDTQLDGVINNAAVGTTLSHRVQLNRGAVLGGGLSLAYRQKSFNWNQLVFEDQLRPGSNTIYPTAERIGESKTVMYDVGVGMMYASEKLMVGFNISHINQPEERFSPESDARLPRRYTMHAAYSFQHLGANKAFNLTPSIIYEQQANLSYLNVGGFWNNDFLTLGTYYRVNQALVFTVGMTIKQFNMGYSYDYNLSTGNSAFGSTNEFSLSYRFKWSNTNKNYKYAGKCPDFYKGLR